MTRLSEIEARAKLAEPGPWIDRCDADNGDVISATGRTIIGGNYAGVYFVADSDRDFVLAAHEDVLWLVDRVKALEVALHRADAALYPESMRRARADIAAALTDDEPRTAAGTETRS